MNFLKRTAGFLAGAVRSVGTTLKILSGGVSVKTEDIPISPTVLDSLSLKDVENWMKRNLATPDEPVKIAVVRESYAKLFKVYFVVLNQRNRRCSDNNGRLRAHAQLVRTISPELVEFFGTGSSVLFSTDACDAH